MKSPLCSVVALAVGILTIAVSRPYTAQAQKLGELPLLNDHQRLTLPAHVVAAADMNGNMPTLITLEERSHWCGNRYFMLNIDLCMERIGSSGDMIRTEWSVTCSTRQVIASGALEDGLVVDVNFRDYSKHTQTAFRAFAYCLSECIRRTASHQR